MTGPPRTWTFEKSRALRFRLPACLFNLECLSLPRRVTRLILKILLVNPNTRTVYNPLPFPPLGLMSVAAVIRDSCQVHIDDRNLYNDRDGVSFQKILRRYEPDLVGITSLTGPAIVDGVLVSRLAKESGATVVWGGTHASLLPEQTLQNPYIDFVVMNEGEETFRELIEAIE